MKWFLDRKTSFKLIASFVIVSLIVAIVGVYGLVNLSKVNDNVHTMYHDRLLPTHNIAEIADRYQRLRVDMLRVYIARTNSEKQQFLNDGEALKAEIESLLSDYNRTFAQKEHEELYKQALASWQVFKEEYDRVNRLSLEGKNTAFLAALDGEYKAIRDELDRTLDQLIHFNVDDAEQSEQYADDLYASTITITIVIIILAALISIGFGYGISLVIARPLGRVAGLVEKVADGDLRETSNIQTKDEIGQLAGAINNMVLRLRQMVGSILASAESVSAASQQISASTEEIASGSSNQADSAHMMNELFKELSVAINSVAHSAEEASELSNSTMNIAQNGGTVVHSSIEGMNRVNVQMAKLEEDSNKIGEIIEVIDDIADQTNLLALNAAIEAARAGDQGRGFAVVADEVRKLAERSSEATKQIASIIKGMQENTRQSVAAVGDGVDLSRKTGEAFDSIASMVNDSANKVAEIAAASEQQAAQSSEVMSQVESISAATEEFAASSEETAATAQSLSRLAEELSRTVSAFRLS